MSVEDVVFGNPGPDGLLATGPGYRIKEEFTNNPNNSHVDGALCYGSFSRSKPAGSQFYLSYHSMAWILDTPAGTTIEEWMSFQS